VRLGSASLFLEIRGGELLVFREIKERPPVFRDMRERPPLAS